MWVDDYTGDATDGPEADALRAAAAEGRPVVVGLRADGRGAAEREAGRLAEELGGVTVCQRLAAGSLITRDGGEAGDAVHFLVCVNIDAASAAAPSSVTEAEAVPLMTGYVRFLEEANRSLSEANVRLARERLGVHDSAAAALVAELQAQREAAQENYEAMLQAKAAPGAALPGGRQAARSPLRDTGALRPASPPQPPDPRALDSALSKRALPRSPREVGKERLLKHHAVRSGGGQPHEDVRSRRQEGVRVSKWHPPAPFCERAPQRGSRPARRAERESSRAERAPAYRPVLANAVTQATPGSRPST